MCLFINIQEAYASALFIASIAGYTEVVDLLISRGATVDYQDKVHEAVFNSYV